MEKSDATSRVGGAAWKCWSFHILKTQFYSCSYISLHSPCDKKICYFNKKKNHHDQKLTQDWERPDQTWKTGLLVQICRIRCQDDRTQECCRRWLCRMVLLVRWQGTNYMQVQAHSAVSKARIHFSRSFHFSYSLSLVPTPTLPSPLGSAQQPENGLFPYGQKRALWGRTGFRQSGLLPTI